MNVTLFLGLLIVHFIGDFYLQTDQLCVQKEEKRISSWFLYFHAVLIGLLSWLVVGDILFWKCALIIAVTHFIIDAAKTYCKSCFTTFIIDQVLHIAILWLIAIFYFGPACQWVYLLSDFAQSFGLPFLLAILVCLKPTNIFIKLLLDKYKIGIQPECVEIKNAGALIGNLERILTLVFVLVGHWEAIGFIIAAKSLLRFKDSYTAKTEYVLAGTFLSFGIAVIIGIMIKYGF